MTSGTSQSGGAVIAAAPVEIQQKRVQGSRTYGQILKSSALIGGASALNILLGMVRTKSMALLLGPGGMGLMGMYGSIADLARTVAGMGINSSGVRQIAESVASGDTRAIARTVTTLRRVALVLGIAGTVLLVLLSEPVSRLSFGEHGRAGSVALLSLAVLFGSVSAGQLALLQGMRRIADLARTNVVGAVLGTFLSIAIVYFWPDRKQGVVPALVGVAVMALIASWWYSRKIKVEQVPMRAADVSAEVSTLLKFGFVFMASGLMSMGVAYIVRIIVMRKIGEEAAGFYQSAWTLGGLYVGFILQAMGADFFPRLTAVAKDNEECNRLVNEQTEVGLLMAGPGVLGTLTFAPLVISIFYSSRFGPAVEILRWICLGMILRVASWPMAFIMLAKGTRQPYFWTEAASCVVQIALNWAGVNLFGLNGTGMAFFGGYLFYGCLIYAIVRALSGFRWSKANRRLGLLYGVLISGVFAGWYFLPRPVVIVCGIIITGCTGLYSLRTICKLIPLERLPGPVRRLLSLLQISSEPKDA